MRKTRCPGVMCHRLIAVKPNGTMYPHKNTARDVCTMSDQSKPIDEARCHLDTCGVVIPEEMATAAGGPGYCCSEHEREASQT